MKIKIQSVLNAVLITACVLIAGCQKENLQNIASEVSPVAVENARKAIGEKIAREGYKQQFEINKRLSNVFVDMEGNIVDNPTANNLVSACAGSFPNYTDIERYYRAYVCGVGYLLSIDWLVSWDNNIVNTHPTNPANKTTLTFRVSIPGNANAYVENITAGVTIVDLGPDPNNPGSNIFSVKGTAINHLSPVIVNTTGAVLRVSARFVADCTALEDYAVTPIGVVGLGYDVPLGSAACSRNDGAYYNPPGSVATRKFNVWGYDPLGTCPTYTAGVAPTVQYIQYSLDNGATWNNFTSTSNPFSPLNTSSFVHRTDFVLSPLLAPGTYDIKIRYANVEHNTGVSVYNIPNATNSCITGGWGTEIWSVQSFPGTVVL